MSASASVASEQYSLADRSTELVVTSQWEKKWTARDTTSVRLQLLGRVLCCRNKPRIRWIRSKGAILILLWNCLILNYYGNLGPVIAVTLPLDSSQASGETVLILTLIQALSLMLLYPLAGWVADVYFGRYRVIKASLWLMWTGAILLSISLCINQLLSPDNQRVQTAVKAVIFPIALLAMEVGIAGFKANAIPFGIDQLSTGSGDQLSGFIMWFMFTLFINIGVISFPFSCPLLASYSDTFLLQTVYQAVLLSIALVLDSFCRHWLALEPRTSNPFKLVARVLNYARKNKQPQFRSAFTYQEDMKPSRIEYAKSSYGGPFSTEQVEDVKTFLRLVCALIPMGATIVMDIYALQTTVLFSEHINPGTLSCYAYKAVSSFVVIMLFSVPLYEFFLRPFLHNYIPSMLTRVGIAIILTGLSYIAFFSIDFIGQRAKSYTCLFDGTALLNINPLWTILPGCLAGLGNLVHAVAVYEFVFSQSPYNMKGLLMGTVYGISGVFHFLGLAIQFPFLMGYTNAMTAFPTCGSVYTLLLLALNAVWFVVYVLVARGYHRRERGETKRQQDYPEEYYSKYLTSRLQ